MRLIKGRYYWIGSKGDARPCQPLGGDYVTALIKWREIEGLNETTDTVAAMLDHFIATHPTKSANTTREYVRLATKLKKVMKGFAISDVKPVHVRQILANSKSKVEANHLVVLLSSAFNKARGDGIYDGVNPCAGIKRHSAPKRTRRATVDEQAALVKGHGAMPIACELALLLGLRVSDIRLMRLDQLTEAGIEVQPAKTKDSTGVQLLFEWTPALRACIARAKLLRRRVGSVYLFPNRKGKACTYFGWYSLWRNHRRKCGVGVDLQFKDLRRTALAATKAAHGTDAAREFAGHGSVTTTEGYLHASDVVRVRPTR
jgi:integrase